MAWTTPMTAVHNQQWTAALWNTHVRDNLLETMPGKATTAGRWFISTGVNAIVERRIESAVVATSQSTTSTSYTNLTTSGPAVSTVATGTRALVFFSASIDMTTASSQGFISYAVSGATTIASNDARSALSDGMPGSGNANAYGGCHMVTNLNSGNNTFTMQYRSSSGTVTFSDREIVVFAL